MMSWREFAKAFPQLTLIDVDAYCYVLDEVDRSILVSQAAHGECEGLSMFGWGDPVLENSTVVGVVKRPIAPIRATDPASVAIAALQRLVWNRAATWSGGPLAERTDSFYIVDSMAQKLLKRRLALTTDSARDLLKFAIYPGVQGRDYDEFLYAVLKQVESSFNPPAPTVLHEELSRLSEAISGVARTLREKQTKFRQKPSTARLDKASARVATLLGAQTI